MGGDLFTAKLKKGKGLGAEKGERMGSVRSRRERKRKGKWGYLEDVEMGRPRGSYQKIWNYNKRGRRRSFCLEGRWRRKSGRRLLGIDSKKGGAKGRKTFRRGNGLSKKALEQACLALEGRERQEST